MLWHYARIGEVPILFIILMLILILILIVLLYIKILNIEYGIIKLFAQLLNIIDMSANMFNIRYIISNINTTILQYSFK